MTIEISDDLFSKVSLKIAQAAMSEQGVHSACLAGFTPSQDDVTHLAELSIQHGLAVFDLTHVSSRV